MIIYIKNMICLRCKMAVQKVLEDLKIDYLSIELGKVSFGSDLTSAQIKKFEEALKYYELELMGDRKKILVERIKILIAEIFQSSDDEKPVKFSQYLSKKLNLEYNYLANIFSETEGSTIEKFFILSKIERVKQLLVIEGLSIKEISYQLNYSSESHLCQQFKKVTGQTPSIFKKSFHTEIVAEGYDK